MAQQKKIIFFTLLLFVISTAYLFYVSRQGLDPNLRKNWWVVYFENPKSADLNFVIENHNDQTNFRWEILVDNVKQLDGGGEIQKGATKNISLNLNAVTGKKVTVDVFNGTEKKEIYKNL